MAKGSLAKASTHEPLGTHGLWGDKKAQHVKIKMSGGWWNTPRTCRTLSHQENDMPEGTCLVDGCDKRVYARGWCNAHYTRWKRHDDPLGGGRTHTPKGSTSCEHEGCVRAMHANGLCVTHGNAANAARYAEQPCSIEDCPRPMHRRGWCAAHYQRWRAYGHPLDGGPTRRVRGTGMGREWYWEKRRASMETPTADTLDYIEILRGDPCAYCGAPREHTDHIHPVSKGGRHHWSNMTAACAACNHRKSNNDLLTFMLKRVA
jgi:hypothetical protein